MQRYIQAFETMMSNHPQAGNCNLQTDMFQLAGPSEPTGTTSARPDRMEERLKVHEYERQRMGQELHDSAGQLLAALHLNIAHLKIVEQDAGHDDLIAEIQDTVQRIDQEIRALAFLHYPAELGERSLPMAVRSLASGFGRRTGIETEFKCLGNCETVGEASAFALLRVAQEALVNVHRHAHASSVNIVLERERDSLHLTVSDDGIGLATDDTKPKGIGLQGMRHRLETLGGQFQIEKLDKGTRLRASVPFAA